MNLMNTIRKLARQSAHGSKIELTTAGGGNRMGGQTNMTGSDLTDVLIWDIGTWDNKEWAVGASRSATRLYWDVGKWDTKNWG